MKGEVNGFWERGNSYFQETNHVHCIDFNIIYHSILLKYIFKFNEIIFRFFKEIMVAETNRFIFFFFFF